MTSPAAHQQLIPAIRQGILNLAICSTFVYIVDSGHGDHYINPLLSSNGGFETFALLSLLQQWDLIKLLAVPWRFDRPCYITFCHLGDALEEQNGTVHWTPMQEPSYPLHEFYFFITNAPSEDSSGEDAALRLAKSTRELLLAFILIASAGQLEAYQLDATGTDIIKVTEQLKSGHNPSIFKPQRPNYLGAKIAIVNCIPCDSSLAEYHQTGSWTWYFPATVYELYRAVNATIEFKTHFSSSGGAIWDRTYKMLIEDSAAMQMALSRPNQGNQAVYFSVPINYLPTCFITRRPQRIKQGVLQGLIFPLQLSVWCWSIASLVCIYLALELVAFVKKHRDIQTWAARRRGVKRENKICSRQPLGTLAVLIKPTIDQTGTLDRGLEDRFTVRALFAVWLLVVIVVGSAYKSKIIEIVVLPAYKDPPSTFEQLAASGYRIYVAFRLQVYKENFFGLRNEYGKQIAERLEQVNGTQGLCDKALGDKTACLDSEFIVGICLNQWSTAQGTPLCQKSKECGFFNTVQLAVNKRYVALYGTLNRITMALHSTGIMLSFHRNQKQVVFTRGVHHARKSMRMFKIFSGKEDFKDDSVLRLAIQVTGLGAAAASIAFVAEISRKFFDRCARAAGFGCQDDVASIPFQLLF